jgi:membrane protein
MRSALTLFRSAIFQWREHNAASLAAALAYYALVSIVPLVVLAIAGLGIFFDRTATIHQVQAQISSVAGKDIGQLVADVASSTRRSNNLFVAIVSALITVFASLGLFNHIRSSLDRMFHAPKEKKMTWKKNFLRNISLFVIFGAIGLVLLLSALLTTDILFIAQYLFGAPKLMNLLNVIFFFLMTTLFVTSIYRLLPSIKLPWKALLIGAVATSLFLTLGKLMIGWYLGAKDPASVYGGASAVVALLIWVYYSAQIFYFGVEFTYIYAKRKQYLN